MTSTQLFHCLHYADALGARSFLTALGFTEVLVVTDPDDPSVVRHAEFRWRDTGGVMFGSRGADAQGPVSAEAAGCYLVAETDDEVDAIHARAIEAGGTSVESPSDMPYGGRGCTIADPEGNHWSIGSYPGR